MTPTLDEDAELEEIFRTEAEAILQDLERTLLSLERGGAGGEAQAEAYRLFHTLKGMANLAGLEQVGAICHEAETALAPGRKPQPDHVLSRFDAAKRLLHGGGHLEGGAREGARSVPVDVRRLDNLLNLAGELTVAETRLVYEWRSGRSGPTEATVSRLTHLVRSLQDEVMRARLIPVRTLFEQLPRLARDAAKASGKRVRVEMEDASLELDRAVVDRVTGALAHVVQNAVIHGIETPEERARADKSPEGVVRVVARRSNEMAIIQLEDDGRGINVERIARRAVECGLLAQGEALGLSLQDAVELLMKPGFTTVEAAGRHAGRGVGLTAAREVVLALGGDIHVDSREGEGTRVTLTLPPSVAVLDTLIAQADGVTVALPLRNVRRIVPASAHRPVAGEPCLLHAGIPIPVLSVEGRAQPPPEGGFVVVSEASQGTFGLAVNRVIGTHASVLKPLAASATEVRTTLGATVLGSGRLALVLNLDGYTGVPFPSS